MEVISDIPTLRKQVARLRTARRIAFVPTMGALHDGHRACVDTACAIKDALVVVSIFVNPTQFGPGEDYDAYPRARTQDLDLCRRWGCDLVFTPDVTAMYADKQRVWVDVDELGDVLCGRRRPGHFRGVMTVVAKLFNLVGPDIAVFGQKDAQQALVIREMVRQLAVPTEIRIAPTAREADGLARSSRNSYLSGSDRPRAAGIYSALTAGLSLIESGERSARAVEAAVSRSLDDAGIESVEYVELRDATDLSALDAIAGRVILAVAVRIAATRLIDNVVAEIGADVVQRDVPLF